MIRKIRDKYQTYNVTIRREDEQHALAEAHGHSLQLGVHRGDPDAGFNAAETLLAALGACILTNVNTFAAKMRLQIDDVRIEFSSLRRNEPPGLVQIDYELILTSPEPQAKLQELHALSVKWGTVTNTLLDGVAPNGALRVERPDASSRMGKQA